MDYKAAFEEERSKRLRAEKALDEKVREVDSSINMIRYQFSSIASQKRGLELLLNMAQMAELRLERDAVLKVFTDAVGQLLEADYGMVFLRNKQAIETGNLSASPICYLPHDEYSDLTLSQLSGQRCFSPDDIVGQKVMEGTNVIEVKSGQATPHTETQALWLVYFPIRKNGKLESVVEFGVSGWTKESENYLTLSMAAAAQIGVMLERSDAHHKLEKNYLEIKQAHDQLKATQSQLVHSEKMASIGQLAAGVAHEINNPVGFVMSNIDTLQEYMQAFLKLYNEYEGLVEIAGDINQDSGTIISNINQVKQQHDFAFILEDIEQVIQDSSEGLSRVKEIVMSLKNFARVDSDELGRVEIDKIIEDALKMIWNELKYHVELSKDLAASRPIPGNAAQLSQVFVNLIMNASQAIEGRGNIAIRSHQDEHHTYIRVEDDGCGIPEPILKRIFDPFYTTKPMDIGTGLGLSISHGIIEKHAGSIDVESETGKGTCFTIRLPNRSG
ncbi:MAG: ATP-binding protein [Pseudomonadota bacterium]|nr:ATP-binding protein [Pseudomonadota bacterium]